MLPDILASGLRAVICGTAVGTMSASVGHYYARPGNDFWRLLHESGLTPQRLAPQDDSTLPQFGLGLTDLTKNVAQSHDRGLAYDVDGFRARIDRFRPAWVVLHGKEAGRAARGSRGPLSLGVQTWQVADVPVFVVPSASGANRRASYDGRPSRLTWWAEMASVIKERSA